MVQQPKIEDVRIDCAKCGIVLARGEDRILLIRYEGTDLVKGRVWHIQCWFAPGNDGLVEAMDVDDGNPFPYRDGLEAW